jgi:anti-sigma regulatory factor (Ser/Thr protein kinase)
MTEPLTMKITLPNVPDIELVAIEGMERLARFMEIAEDKLGEVKIMLTEAIINALEHSGNTNPGVDVEFTVTPKELVIFVRDYGKGFEQKNVEEPDINKKIGSIHKRGWGLKLMKEMSDDLKIESNGTGTRITIKKFLS